MKNFKAWLMHAAISMLTALVTTGAIYDLLPRQYHHEALTLIPVMFYLLGVKMPTPGKDSDVAKDWNALSGR